MKPMSKEDDWKIIKLFDIDSTNISNEALGFYNEWLIDTSRQEMFQTHEHTFMYELIPFNYEWMPGQNHRNTPVNKLSPAAEKDLVKIYKMLEDYANGTVIHSEIISMKPNSRIRTHKDRGDLFYLMRRFHIPLKTNPETFFIVDEEKFFLEEGHIYELNNSRYHGVRNESNKYRIHLIIDVMPNEYLGKANLQL